MNPHPLTKSQPSERPRFHTPVLLAALCAAVLAAPPSAPAGEDGVLELSPESLRGYTLVESPTRESVAELRASGKLPLVLSEEFADEAVAFTNWAENASAVAFDQIPRSHLRHSWKLLGVKVLKTVRFQREGSPARFRREASFLAFQSGADGIWLPDAGKLPADWRAALAEAREDWRILLRLDSLAEQASRHPDGNIRIEARRVAYWFSWMPADWENADLLRLECVAYVKRLEQLLGVPAADMPVRRPEKTLTNAPPLTPYAGWAEKPEQIQMKKLGDTIDLGGGLFFRADHGGFSITYSTTNGPPLGRHQQPGGTLDFRLYIAGEEPGTFLPYYFHCDFNPRHYSAVRAPDTGRNHFLFGTDERFRPFYIAYATPNPRIWTWPRLRDYGPDYPDPRPSLRVEGNKRGGWRATVSFSWISFYGHWPMQTGGKTDLWFVGLDRSPETGRPLAARILWPRGHADNFRQFAERLRTSDITDIYKRELGRTEAVWTTAEAERFYPFAQTATPTFHRYDLEGDRMFFHRLVRPLLDANKNAWELVWTDKEHPEPKFIKQPDSIRLLILQNLGRMLYMSHEVGLRRLDYLVGRYEGREPPDYTPPPDPHADAPGEPDADYDPDGIQLDDKEF